MKYFFIVFLCAFFSCTKTESTKLFSSTNAVIRWTGIVAADGCDWTIQIGSISYHPEELAESFKIDNLKVSIEYHLYDDKFPCGNSSPGAGLPIIHIVSVKQ
ncbi:MAG: hypothetical protein ACKVOW_02840 [Chitinophagaceae bacterium]